MNSSLKKDQIIEEARIMKAIRHPYILSIKDIFDDEENIYMILELATGGDLFDAVVTKGIDTRPGGCDGDIRSIYRS